MYILFFLKNIICHQFRTYVARNFTYRFLDYYFLWKKKVVQRGMHVVYGQ